MKGHRMKKTAVIVIIICSCLRGMTQSLPDLKFTHITTKDGLSGQYIRYIYQDSRGLIWICTTSGLNRYDGNQFKVYKNIPGQANCLPSDYIWNIVEDKKGNFWVGTENGLSYFEPNENRFTNYLHEPGNKNSLTTARAENLVLDEDGYLWVGSLSGLQRFNPITKVFDLIQFANAEDLAFNPLAQSVYFLYIDKKKQLWVNAGGDLYRIDRRSLSSRKIAPRLATVEGVNSIYQDKDGDYWICYWGRGFAKFDGEHTPKPQDFITNESIYFRFAEWRDIHNNSWLVVTKDEGIGFYNKLTHTLTVCKHDDAKPESFGSHGSGVMLADNDNNLWIGGVQDLELLETSRQFFTYHWLKDKKDPNDNYAFGVPQPVFKDGDYYWAGLWYAKGLLKLDTAWKITKYLPSFSAIGSAEKEKTAYGFYKDEDGSIWISTESSIMKYNESTGRSVAFLPEDIHPHAFEFRKILALGRDRFFVRTLHHGVYVFNRSVGIFEKRLCTENTANFPSNDVGDMAYDKKGRLWLATNNGICSIDTSSLAVMQTYNHTPGKTSSLVNNHCRSLSVDDYGNIWIGADGGLNKVEIEKGRITTYTTSDGLSNNIITKLVVDRNNNIWMNTENGVSVFQQSTNSFRNFYMEDGLPQNSLGGTIDKDAEGNIYLGDAGMVITVNPADIPFNGRKPRVIITDVSLGDKHYPVKTNSRGEKFLETNAANSFVTVNFAVLNFNSPRLNKYYYKLEGVDAQWHQGDRGIASYIGIIPGKFVLKVKGSNNNGVMNEEGDFIIIIVNPEWYQTIWFKLLVIASLALGVFLLVRYRINAIRKESAFKQRIIETEMQSLRAQMNPHFIFNSLNSIENFIMQNEKRLASDYLNKFARLVRMILDSSRNELVPISKDMEALQLYIDLEQLRFNNKFAYKTYIDPTLLNNDYRVPSLLIQPYVENAIVHGLAHSYENDLVLTVMATLEGDTIKYVVQDNGVGREQARVYRQQNKPRHSSLGLKITEERVNLFNNNEIKNGSVRFTDLYDADKTPRGTRVEITIKAT